MLTGNALYAGTGKGEPFGNKRFYASWGYSRGWFSPSDLYFKGTLNDKNYELKVHKAKAHDRPDFNHILPQITIPQFNARFGYVFNKIKGFAIELNYDHAKYVVTDYQTADVTGYYGERQYDGNTVLAPDTFLHFEHTNGANYWMLNFVYCRTIIAKRNMSFCALFKAGEGILIPKTDVTLFGQRFDNKFHVAGNITAAEVGLRLNIRKTLYIEPAFKYAFCNYSKVLTVGDGTAHHKFRTAQIIFSVGARF